MDNGDLGNLLNTVGSPLEQELKKFNKMAAGHALKGFKRAASTCTEPLFRVGMGERYFTQQAYFGGAVLWILASILSYYISDFLFSAHTYTTPSKWDTIVTNVMHACSIFTDFILVAWYLLVGSRNMDYMQRLRNEGVAYHTMSRGVARFGPYNLHIGIFLLVILLLFNLVAAVLFLISRIMVMNMVAEQEAAIMSRYYDEIDREIERQHLKPALLGECPPEITYLTRPLSTNMNEELRDNISGAAVGEKVTLLAKPRNRGKKDKTEADKAPPEQPADAKVSEQPPQNPIIEPAPMPVNEVTEIKVEAKPTDPAPTSIVAPVQNFEWMDVGKVVVTLLLSVALALGAIKLFDHFTETAPDENSWFSHGSRDDVPDSIIQRLAAKQASTRSGPSEEDIARQNAIAAMNTVLTKEKDALTQFTNDSAAVISEDLAKLDKLASSARDQLQNQIEQIQASVRSTSEAQQGLMQKIEPQIPALLRTPLANIQMNTVAIADVFKKTEKDRDDLNAKLAELAVAISNAPPKSFWRFWRN